jgi:hypothetical protein
VICRTARAEFLRGTFIKADEYFALVALAKEMSLIEIKNNVFTILRMNSQDEARFLLAIREVEPHRIRTHGCGLQNFPAPHLVRVLRI